MQPTFVHLGIHSEFSITDSIIRIDELVSQARADGMPALALTDLSNLYAAVKFYQACHREGIKPVLGSELRISDDATRVIVLAMDQTGWGNLTDVVSMGFTDGLQQGIPLVEREWLLERSAGLIVLLGQHSEIGQALLGPYPDRAAGLLADWQAAFGDRVYLALSRTRREGEDEFIAQAVALADAQQVDIVACQPVRFMAADDFEAHEARVCIARSETLISEKRERLYSPEQYFKSQAEMAALFDDLPDALANSLLIAQRCNVSLILGKNYLPAYPVPVGDSIDSFFERVCRDGLDMRLDASYPVAERGTDWPEVRRPYDERLAFEIKTILDMGFPGYFLIVMDFIQWAKHNGVPVGPGRGSGAGSLVAYALNITDLDPLHYDLLFERFLNPERISMPDFDVDFCIAGRDRVIDYVAQRYGRDAVSQIITFGTLAAKAVLRDVARVQGKSFRLAESLSKLIPAKPIGIGLQEARQREPLLQDMLSNPDHPDHEDANEIWDMAIKLEGITRNVGKHAGGVLIAPNKITDFTAIYCDQDGSRVSQFDKDDVEAVGLVKFDFLGLRNLTVIDQAVRAINARRQREQEPALDLATLPLDDAKPYALLQQAKTTAVFQLESAGMKKYLARLQPSNIEDIIAMCALYRPGPLDAGMVDSFIDRKHGREKVVYDHPDLEPILKATYGVIVYQEQVMQIAQVLAGYTLGAADMLRRAMGKKKPEEMAKQREIFVSGASQHGIDGATSGGIFDLMEKFAGYGFNRSHSAAYGVVAYQTAWLKAHYPAEFMGAVLTSDMDVTDKVVFSLGDCRELGLTVLPPCVNRSDFAFQPTDDLQIIYGLGAIKGVGEGAMLALMEARAADGPFTDLFDFCRRIDLRKANKRTLEALIKSGALDNLAPEVDGSHAHGRATLMASLDEAVRAAEQTRQNQDTGMADLFGDVVEAPQRPNPKPVAPWPDDIRLKGEKDTLGLYLTGHPMDRYRDELRQLVTGNLAEVESTGRGQTRLLAGLVMDVRPFPNRLLITLDDGMGRFDLTCHTEKAQRFRELLKPEAVLIIEASIQEREGDTPIGRVQRVFDLAMIRRQRLQCIEIEWEINSITADKLPAMQQILQQYAVTAGDEQGQGVPVQLRLIRQHERSTWRLAERWQIEPSDEALRALSDLFGLDKLKLRYRTRQMEVMNG